MLISLTNIEHSYKNSLFHQISGNIEYGDFFAIYWPSGSGKSTLLEILWKIIQPTSWEIVFHKSLKNRNKEFWYAFIGWPFFEEMSTKDNILFLKNFSNISINEKKYEEMMDFFGMKKFEHTPIKLLSIWQRERANIIRAFVHEPKIIILDEPWSNLDDILFEKLLTFLKKEKESKSNAIIIATHHSEYKNIANKIIKLEPYNND